MTYNTFDTEMFEDEIEEDFDDTTPFIPPDGYIDITDKIIY